MASQQKESFNPNTPLKPSDHFISESPSTTADNDLRYLHEVYDILSTDDGSDLTGACISQYAEAWEVKVQVMMGTVNEVLEEGLCEDGDAASVQTYTSSFATLGPQVKR